MGVCPWGDNSPDRCGAVGILSTARINAKLLAGAREAAGVEVVAVGSRDRARGEAFAAEHGIGRVHGSYEALLGRRRRRGGLHPAPELAARAVVGQGAGGRQARPVREAADAPRGRRRGGVRRRRARRAAADGGVHVALPPADRGARAAGAARSRRCASCAPRSASRCRRRPGERAAAGRARGRRADGRRLLLRQRAAAAGRRAGARRAARLWRRRRRRRRLRRRAALPRRRARACSTAASTCRRAACIEVVGEGGTLVAEDPWHGARRRGSTRDGEEIPVEAADPYAAGARGLLGGDPRRRRAARSAAPTRSGRRARSRRCTRRPSRLSRILRISRRGCGRHPDNARDPRGGDICEGSCLRPRRPHSSWRARRRLRAPSSATATASTPTRRSCRQISSAHWPIRGSS